MAHLIVTDPAARGLVGACFNVGLRAASGRRVHLPTCDTSDCYCVVDNSSGECQSHTFIAASNDVILCDWCKQLPAAPLTHGQVKHARDLAKAARKRVVADRYSDAALARDAHMLVLWDAVHTATDDVARAAARDRVEVFGHKYYDNF